MKILYYFSKNQSVMYRWQAYHIFDELRNYNCEFDEFYPEDYESVEDANKALINRCKYTKYDMFMTSHNEKKLFINTLKDIRKIGIKTLLFCPDNLKVPFNHKNIAKYFDLVWLTAEETKYLFDSWGAHTIFMPYAANPYFLIPGNNFAEIDRIGFVGTPYGSRVSTINALLNADIDVSLHTAVGNAENRFINDSPKNYCGTLATYARYPIGRKLALSAIINKFQEKHRNVDLNNPHLKLEKPVPLTHLGEVYSQYALSLSYGAAGSSEILRNPVDVVNLRNFEIPMAGGVQFTRYTKELANYFKEDEEIIFYRSKKDMIEKAEYYLSEQQKDKRLKMRVAARNRAVKDHTWYNRFKNIFDAFGLNNYVRRDV